MAVSFWVCIAQTWPELVLFGRIGIALKPEQSFGSHMRLPGTEEFAIVVMCEIALTCEWVAVRDVCQVEIIKVSKSRSDGSNSSTLVESYDVRIAPWCAKELPCCTQVSTYR